MGAASKLRNHYPAAFKQCIPEAMRYGHCVSSSLEIRPKECDKEFRQLNECFKLAIKRLK